MAFKAPSNAVELQFALFGDTSDNLLRSASAAGLSSRLMMLQARFNACAKEAVTGNEPPVEYQDWLVAEVERMRADRDELVCLRVYRNSNGVPAEIYFLREGEDDSPGNRVDIPLDHYLEIGLEDDFWETDLLWPEEERPRIGMRA